MTAHGVAIVLGIGGVFLLLSMSAPQAWTIWRDRSATGVSGLTWSLFCLTFCLWLGYAIRVGNLVVAVSNLLAAASAAVLMIGLARSRGWRPLSPAAIGLAIAAAMMFFLGLRGPMPVIITLMLLGPFVRAPQVVSSWSTLRHGTRSEVSLLTWWMSLLAGVIWMLHGLLFPDMLVAVASATVVVLSIVVLALEYTALRRRSAEVMLNCAGVLPTHQMDG